MAQIKEATRLAHEAVRADTERRLPEAERCYREAAQGLREACLGANDATRAQLTPHIEHYSSRAEEISRQLTPALQEANGGDAAAMASGSVDPSALQLMMEMGFTSEQSFEALLRFDNNMERSMNWLFENPGAPAVASPPPRQQHERTLQQQQQQQQALEQKQEQSLQQQPQHEYSGAGNRSSGGSGTSVATKPGAASGAAGVRGLAPSESLGHAVTRGGHGGEATTPVNISHTNRPIATAIPASIPPASEPSGSLLPQPLEPRPHPTSTSVRQASPSLASSATSDSLAAVLAAAQVSETGKCRCLLFSVERGGCCGMPAALTPPPANGDDDDGGSPAAYANALCWSCKYMEAVSDMDASTLHRPDGENDNGGDDLLLFRNALGKGVGEDAPQCAGGLALGVAIATAPAAVPQLEETGGVRGWLSNIGGALLGHTAADDEQPDRRRQQLLLEYQQLTKLKQTHGADQMPEPARRRRQELKRLLSRNTTGNSDESVGSSSSSQGTANASGGNRSGVGGGSSAGGGAQRVSGHAAAPPSAGIRPTGETRAGEAAEVEVARVARLRGLLRAARVSESEVCQETLYSVSLGETCGRPAALVPSPTATPTGGGEGGEETVGLKPGTPRPLVPSRLCWQCKRIEAFSM